MLPCSLVYGGIWDSHSQKHPLFYPPWPPGQHIVTISVPRTEVKSKAFLPVQTTKDGTDRNRPRTQQCQPCKAQPAVLRVHVCVTHRESGWDTCVHTRDRPGHGQDTCCSFCFTCEE